MKIAGANNIKPYTRVSETKIPPKTDSTEKGQETVGDSFAPSNPIEGNPLIKRQYDPCQAPWVKSQRPAELVEKTADGKVTARNVRWGFKDIPIPRIRTRYLKIPPLILPKSRMYIL